MSVENEAKRLARKAIAEAYLNSTEGRRNINMLPSEAIDAAVKVLLAEDDKYLTQAKRNLGLLHN